MKPYSTFASAGRGKRFSLWGATCVMAAGLVSCASQCGTPAPPAPSSSVSSELEARPRYRRFDAHAHIQPAATAEALEFYRSHGVEAAVNVSGRFPGYGLEEAAAAARNSAGRMFFMCNIPWQIPVDHPRFLELGRLALQRCRDVGGVGWKIHKVLGLGATYIDGRLVPVDAPELDPLFELAGQLGLPVLMHVGDPQAFFRPPTPDNERYEELRAHPGWSFFGPEFPSWEEIFAQFERRVARHRRVTFIGAHFGNAPEEPRRVGQMLERYSNYFIDTAARIPEIGRHDPQLMHDFFVRHQDRILFASDLGYGRGWGGRLLSLGSSGEEPPQAEDIERFWQATYRYFETDERDFAHPTPIQGRWTISGIALPPPVLRKLYHENAERVLGVSLP